jgi:stage II sporulation protein M
MMANKKFLINFEQHIKDNFWLYIISVVCFFIGVIAGIYAVKNMGSIEENNLLSYLKNFTNSITIGNVSYNAILIEAVKTHIPLLIAMWFLGLTIVGIPIILIVDFIKGFTIGYTITVMIKALGMKGIGLSILMVLPQNFIYIPCIIISSVIAMEFSLMLLKDKMSKQWTSNLGSEMLTYSFTFLFICLVMCLGFILESYLTPNIVRLLVKNIGSIFA